MEYIKVENVDSLDLINGTEEEKSIIYIKSDDYNNELITENILTKDEDFSKEEVKIKVELQDDICSSINDAVLEKQSANIKKFLIGPVKPLSTDRPRHLKRLSKKPITPQKMPLKREYEIFFSDLNIELDFEKEFRLYLENFTNDAVVPCPKCPIKFVSKTLLEHHYASHLIIPPFFCPLCNKITKDKRQLISHFRKHEKFPFACNKCNVAFKNEAERKDHYILLHYKEENNFPQISEPEKITFKNLLHEFLIRQSSLTSLENRKEQPHSPTDSETPKKEIKKLETPPQYIVPLTLESEENKIEFEEEKEIRLYLESHRDKETIKCLKCEIKFAHKHFLEQHYSYHLIRPPYLCPICPGKFKDDRGFISHLRHHAKTLGCNYCKLLFGKKSDLKVHLLMHGSKTQPQTHSNEFFKRILHEYLFKRSIKTEPTSAVPNLYKPITPKINGLSDFAPSLLL